MKYIDLFNEIQLSRDYHEDLKTGANWRYHVDDDTKRVYIEFQETKTNKDWLYNILIIPKLVKSGDKKIVVPLGFALQAEAVCKYIQADFLGKGQIHLPSHYDYYFAGWSLGGAVAGISGFILGDLLGIKRHLIQYGTPAYCFTEKSLQTLIANFSTVKDFLYDNDWIYSFVPLYKRPPSFNVKPCNPDNPQTLDQRHRVYGHCKYSVVSF